MPADHQLDLVHRAIAAGIFGNIEWKESAAQLVRNSPEMNGLMPDAIRARLRDFVVNGGQLDVRAETRPEYFDPDDPFWYRALIPIEDYPRPLFIEVRILDDDADEPFVKIVSAHF